MDKDFFEREAQSNPFSPFLTKIVPKDPPPASREASPQEERNGFLPFFFVELLDRFKNTLNSLKTLTHLSREKLNDEEFRDYFYKVMNEDIEEIDSVIDSLLNYIKINTPIVKSNTVHTVLDEVVKKNERDLNSKKIKIIKKFEKELPETTVHEAQLRYIFNCILGYAIPYTLPNGSIGFLTKISEIPRGGEEDRELAPGDGRHVEVIVIFTGCKKQGEQGDTRFGGQPARKEERMDLKLLLVKEIVRKNHGILKFEVDEKKPRTQISLFFPIERRRLISYQFPNS